MGRSFCRTPAQSPLLTFSRRQDGDTRARSRGHLQDHGYLLKVTNVWRPTDNETRRICSPIGANIHRPPAIARRAEIVVRLAYCADATDGPRLHGFTQVRFKDPITCVLSRKGTIHCHVTRAASWHFIGAQNCVPGIGPRPASTIVDIALASA